MDLPFFQSGVGLGEKCPHILMYLNSRPVVVGGVWEGLGVESCWRMYVGKVFES